MANTNKQILFASRPNPNASLENFKVVTDAPTPEESSLQDGQVLLRLVYVSVDPYMRGRMNEGKSYFPGFEIGKPISGGTVAEVISSKNSVYSTGEYVVAFLPWQLVQIVSADQAKSFVKIPNEVKSLASYFIGSCGMPGLSALLPIEHIGAPKAGEVAFVSGAAGAVGSTAGQIFKILGLKVYGSAGSDDKVKLLKDLGFDGAWNYNTTNLDKVLSEAVPEGIDIYFDNVGGQTLEILLNHMKKYGRIIACGAISQYQKGGWENAYGIRNIFTVVSKSLKLQGFIVTDWAPEFAAGTAKLVGWVREGKLKVTETVREGFENLPSAFVGLLAGENQGKMVVKI